MPNFPNIPEVTRLARLEPPTGKIRMVLDTDTYNEIDDQFALAYALRSPEKLTVEAIYAAPFFNTRSSGPGDGMEKSYKEILRLLDRLNISPEGLVHKGSTGYLVDDETPQDSPAARDLVQRAMASSPDDPLYVVPIGAITNVASAILLEPAIIDRIVIVWLGGNALFWPHALEFNLMQDIPAARLIFDCGVPMVHIPCFGVTTHLLTTLTELNAFIRGKNAICDFLCERFEDYHTDHYGTSKVIWDVAAIAWLIDARWVPTDLVHSPILTDQGTWSVDRSRYFIRSANYIDRDPIFRDLFDKLKR